MLAAIACAVGAVSLDTNLHETHMPHTMRTYYSIVGQEVTCVSVVITKRFSMWKDI